MQATGCLKHLWKGASSRLEPGFLGVTSQKTTELTSQEAGPLATMERRSGSLHICILTPTVCECYLTWLRRLCRCDHLHFEMGEVSRIIQLGQYNHKGPYKREAEEQSGKRRREKQRDQMIEVGAGLKMEEGAMSPGMQAALNLAQRDGCGPPEL